MKKTAVQPGILWWPGITLGITAQQPERPLPTSISPNSIATQKISRLKEELPLTGKQYEKVYEMLRKEERERFKEHINRSLPPATDTDRRQHPSSPRFYGNPGILPEEPGKIKRHPRHDVPPLSPNTQESDKHRKRATVRTEKKMKKY